MIEQIMFFVLGFFAACLLTLFVAHAVWRRAVRLTTKRVQAALPVSLAEIKADRDQLRAEFAMAARKLEISVEQLKARGHLQLVDITRKNEQLRLLLDEVKKRSDTITAMEERERQLRNECLAAETAFGDATRSLKEAEERLSAAHQKLNERERDNVEAQSLAHTRQVEIAALQANLAHLESIVDDTKRSLSDSTAAFTARQETLDQARSELQAALSHRSSMEEKMNSALAELQEQTGRLGVAQTSLSDDSDGLQKLIDEAKRLAARVNELMSERETLDKELSKRLGEAEARYDILSKEFDTFRAEKAALEVRLGAVHSEREELAGRLHMLENGAASNWERERMENAMLRERMNDLAAEISALSITLEGDATPIRKVIASTQADLQADAISRPTGMTGSDGQQTVSLAERIRVLQARAATSQ